MKFLFSFSAAILLFFSMAEVNANTANLFSNLAEKTIDEIQPPGEQFIIIVTPATRGYKVSGLKATRSNNLRQNEILATIEARDNRIFVHISRLGFKADRSKSFLIFPKGFKLSPQVSQKLGYKSVVMSGGSTMLKKGAPISYIAVMSHPY